MRAYPGKPGTPHGHSKRCVWVGTATRIWDKTELCASIRRSYLIWLRANAVWQGKCAEAGENCWKVELEGVRRQKIGWG